MSCFICLDVIQLHNSIVTTSLRITLSYWQHTHCTSSPILSCLAAVDTTAPSGSQAATGGTLGEGDVCPLPLGKLKTHQWVSLCMHWLFSRYRFEGLHVGQCGPTLRSGSRGEGGCQCLPRPDLPTTLPRITTMPIDGSLTGHHCCVTASGL